MTLSMMFLLVTVVGTLLLVPTAFLPDEWNDLAYISLSMVVGCAAMLLTMERVAFRDGPPSGTQWLVTFFLGAILGVALVAAGAGLGRFLLRLRQS